MKKYLLLLLAFLPMAVAAHGQGVIHQEQIIQWRQVKPAGNPPVGYVYMYFDPTTGLLTCLSSSGGTTACSSLPTTSTANLCLLSTGVGNGSAWGSCAGATSTNWSAIVPGTGTITAGTYNIGTGSTLAATGSGVINATQLGGATFAAPSAIGSGTANTGAFTTLSASSTVSGTGFSTYLASPPAIGGTVAAAGTFTTATVTTLAATTINGAALSGTFTGAPTLSGNVAFTGTPTFSILPTFPSCTANFFLASPNGSSGAPTCRAVVAADIPTLNQNTTGTAANVTGVVALINGGTATAAASANAAFNALSPLTTEGDILYFHSSANARLAIGLNAQCLTSNGTDPVWASCSTGTIGGSGTANTMAKFTASSTIGNSLLTDNATTLAYGGTGGLDLSAGPLELAEITAPSGIASNSLIYATSAHRVFVNNNNGTAAQVVQSGADINTSDQVTITHLASPLPTAQGGTGQNSTATFPTSGTVTVAGSCTNQAVIATLATGVTCATITSSYVNNTIALTGTDINTSNQVTATHLASALPINQGGTGTTSTLTGLVRGSASAMTAAELSQDVTTSGSNAATVVGLRTLALPTLAASTGLLFDTAGVLSLPATLPTSAVPAFTGDMTNSSGSLATTVAKINGAAFSGVAGHVVEFATSTTPGDGGAAAADLLTYHAPVAGIVRTAASSQAVTATELSGDATTGGSNVVTVVAINGNTVPSGAANNQILGANAASTLVWETVPNCVGSTNALNFTQSTNAWSCFSIPTLTNPMTTLGDTMYGGSAGTVTRLAGPTSGNSPYTYVSTPSSGLATAPGWAVSGVPVDSESGATFTIQSDAQTTPDRAKLVLTTNNTTSTAVTVPQAGSASMLSSYPFVHCNTGSVIATDTPTTSTINSNAAAKLVGAVSGHNPECMFWWSDAIGATGNWWGAEILPTDANGRLAAEGVGALTGDVTTSAGSYATTVSKINGTSFTGTNGNLVSFGASNTPADSGLVANNVVQAAADFVTGNITKGSGVFKQITDSGIAAANLVTAASNYTNGGLVYSNGTAKTTANSADWSIQTHTLQGGSNGIFSVTGTAVASTPVMSVTGALFTGGTGTTTQPYFYFNQGATAPTNFSTAGTYIGINAASGFTGNFLTFYVNGGSSVASLSATGALTVASCSGCGSVSLAFPLTVSGTTNSGGIAYFSNATTLSSSAALAANQAVNGGGAGVAPATGFTPTSSGTITSGHLACYTASNTVGNCTGTPSANIIGVFNSSSTWIASGEVSVTLDATVNVTFGDILCASSTAGVSHDNAAIACATGEWVGIVKTTASSVSSATAFVALR